MGFFPADDPQVAMLVILDEPQRDRWGGVAAAPVFRDIGEQILTRFKTNIRVNPLPAEEKQGVDMKLKLVSAPAPQTVQASTEEDDTRIPDFRGMSIREVLRKSKEKGLDVQIIGSGWATEQKPAPGRTAPENRLCTVTFSIGS